MSILKHISLLLLVTLSLCACRKPAPQKQIDTEPSIAKVQVQKITPRSWHQTIRTFGRVEAAEKVTISAEIPGKVNEVLFEEGDQIQAGQTLVTFDVSESRLHLKQAEGNLVGVAARLNEARSMLARREGLYKQRAVSKEQLETARTDVATLEATLEQLTAGRNLARHNIRRTQLQSPVDGTVVSRNVSAGEVAMPGQMLAVLHVTDTMRVTTWVTQEEVNTVRTGIPCTITSNGVRGTSFKAHVESIGNEADPATGNFPVKLTVNNTEGLLKAGMSAMVTLTGLEMNDAILIPDNAVVDRNRRRVVYLVNDNTAREVTPVLAAATGSIRHVLHGLAPGDLLIVGGIDNVIDGSPVEVMGNVPLETNISRGATEDNDELPAKEAPELDSEAEGDGQSASDAGSKGAS